MNMRVVLMLAMVVAGIVPMAITSLVITRQAADNLRESTYGLLTADVLGRKAYIEDYLNNIQNLNGAMSQDPSVIDAMEKFTSAFLSLESDIGAPPASDSRRLQQISRFYERQFLRTMAETENDVPSLDKVMPKSRNAHIAQDLYIASNDYPLGEKDSLHSLDNGTSYDQVHTDFHHVFRDYLQRFEYYDIFLIEPENGTVVYSVFKEIDYATSLNNGPHRDSGLATVAREAMSLQPGETATVDFSNYVPSYGAPAAFVGSPIFSDNKLIGVLAFQMPVSHINGIMTKDDGLGETGELLLVGEDLFMRSQSRFIEEPTILRNKIESESVKIALRGEDTSTLETIGDIDYLAASSPLSIDGLNWVITGRIEADEAMGSIAALYSKSLIVAALSALGVGLFAYLLGLRFYRVLGGDPSEIKYAADLIGAGDLSGKPNDENSTGAYASIVAMRSKLRSVLEESIYVAEEVKAGATQLSNSNNGLSERTEQQAANLEETASSTEELTSTVKQNAENARSANQLAINTRSLATSSGGVANKAVNAMQDISAASVRIADIIGVIDEIAFQTNLLALNAAVEAARAGEQGRGFAVVASEVRQLAGRSASAAKEIKELIEDSVEKVKDGTRLVQESGGELEQIVEAVTELTDIVGQISIASDEQSVGIDQINQALVHMDSVTQQNAAMVEQAATTSRSMRDQATVLSTQIGFFSTNGVEQSAAASNDDNIASTSVENTRQEPAANAEQRRSPGVKANAANDESNVLPIKRASGGEEFWDEF